MSELIEIFDNIITKQHQRFEIIIAVYNIFLTKPKRMLCLLPTNIQNDIIVVTEDSTTTNNKLYVTSMEEALKGTKELVAIPLQPPYIMNNDVQQIIREVNEVINDKKDFYIKINIDGEWEVYSKG